MEEREKITTTKHNMLLVQKRAAVLVTPPPPVTPFRRQKCLAGLRSTRDGNLGELGGCWGEGGPNLLAGPHTQVEEAKPGSRWHEGSNGTMLHVDYMPTQ